MPPMTEDNAKKPLRELIYGPPKTKKTWWAARAAEAGYNVILIDGDDGTHIIKNVDAKAQERIFLVDAVDKLNASVMALFMVNLLKGNPFVWDETRKERILSVTNAKVESSHISIDVSKLTMNDVLVLDSWSALVWSAAFRYSKENSIDLSDAGKTEWEGYRWCGSLLNWMLAQMAALPCHVIVIGHADVWEKKKKDGKTTEFQRTQPKSISGPHGMQLAKHFSDVLFFKIVGSSYKIDATATSDRDGGSRNLAPKSYNWDELSFADLIKASGLPTITPAPLTAVKYYAPGEPVEMANAQQSKAGGVLSSKTASTNATEGKSLTGLLNKK